MRRKSKRFDEKIFRILLYTLLEQTSCLFAETAGQYEKEQPQNCEALRLFLFEKLHSIYCDLVLFGRICFHCISQ